MFIVLEGNDGSGKSTQVEFLASYLSQALLGVEVVTLKEPTDGIWGKKIRSAYAGDKRPDPETELEWFTKDRQQDIEENILPALSRGAIVILDRYYFSTAAYQGSRGNSVDAILEANSNAPVPDLCLVLLCSPTIALARIADRGEKEVVETLEEQRRVVAAYEEIVAKDFPYMWRVEARGSKLEVASKVIGITCMDLVNRYGSYVAQGIINDRR